MDRTPADPAIEERARVRAEVMKVIATTHPSVVVDVLSNIILGVVLHFALSPKAARAWADAIHKDMRAAIGRHYRNSGAQQ